MANQIQSVRTQIHRLDPTEVELWFEVAPEHVSATTELRGRLVGPRCFNRSTVEIPFPLLPRSRRNDASAGVGGRVVILEPCFWEPRSPFLYEGKIELWEDGVLRDERTLRHGFRQLALTPQGLRLNGRLINLRGAQQTVPTEDEARRLHSAGYDTLLTRIDSPTATLWETADRFGLFVLGRVHRHGEHLPAMIRGGEHPSCLGWVFGPELLHESKKEGLGAIGQLIGVELNEKPVQPLPRGIQFVVCKESAVSALAEIDLPKLIITNSPAPAVESQPTLGGNPGILGWIASEGLLLS